MTTQILDNIFRRLQRLRLRCWFERMSDAILGHNSEIIRQNGDILRLNAEITRQNAELLKIIERLTIYTD